jgi:hypothetical protein
LRYPLADLTGFDLIAGDGTLDGVVQNGATAAPDERG